MFKTRVLVQPSGYSLIWCVSSTVGKQRSAVLRTADQNQARVRRPDRATSALHGAQQTSKYITMPVSIASPLVGPLLPLNRALCSLIFFFAHSRRLVEHFRVTCSCCAPHLFVSHTQLHHFTHALQSATSTRSATLLTPYAMSHAV